MFGNADRFMAMVRSSYPVVYRPASVAFLVPEWLDRELIQGVHFTDAQGGLWLAIYRLQRPARQQLAHQRLRARRESGAHDLRPGPPAAVSLRLAPLRRARSPGRIEARDGDDDVPEKLLVHGRLEPRARRRQADRPDAA
jgi:hypothetical protein